MVGLGKLGLKMRTQPVSLVMSVSLLFALACLSSSVVPLSRATGSTIGLSWSERVSSMYPPSSPLRVHLGDTLRIECPPGATSNLWIQSHVEQYENCSCNATGVRDECNPNSRTVCQDEIIIQITTLSIQLKSALGFDAGTTYYFVSYSPGQNNLDGYLTNHTSGGECLRGYRMAMEVAPLPAITTAFPSSTAPSTTQISTTVLSPPTEVHSHCSHVNWRNSPDVSCDDIVGYDVMLSNPETGASVTRRIDALGTFHNFLPSDTNLTRKASTTVQIRVVSSGVEGSYSTPVGVGCLVSPMRVYFELQGKIYANNSVVSIYDIGEEEDALLCITDKEECCKDIQNRFGEYFYPNGTQVPIYRLQHGFYRNRGKKVVRLSRREGVDSPLGRYSCEVPDKSGVSQKIFIHLI